MDYKQAMEFLEETKKYGSQLGLTSIQNLMDILGNIQNQVPIVHIAGTNGKGSVGAMLSAVLQEAGYRVGRFSTPDVFSYEEEFLMDNTPIDRNRLADIFSKVAAACGELTKKGCPHPTRFEVETAAAYLWFWEEACDIAIVEVGMGGETDATNVIEKPLLSVLTSISLDHMKFLGNTLEEIASVKAGIIKDGCPVVTVHQSKEVMDVIQKRCRQTGSRCICADAGKAADVICTDAETVFTWKTGPEEAAAFPRIHLGLRGCFQVENAVCALEALCVLRLSYPRLSKQAVLRGLCNVRWPGRFEKIGEGPDFYLDGAHNEGAVKRLRQTVDIFFPERRVIYILGVLADKEYRRMIQLMFQPGDRVFTVTPKNPRALGASGLTELLLAQKIDAVYCENGENAVLCAMQEAKEEDVIVAFGSLSYLCEIREAYEKFSEGNKRER